MTNQEIENLKNKVELAELKTRLENINKPEHGGHLGQQFEEMGKSFQGMAEQIPHVKIGSDDPNKPPREYPPLVEKARKWLFLILVILVGGTALGLIVMKIIGRFF